MFHGFLAVGVLAVGCLALVGVAVGCWLLGWCCWLLVVAVWKAKKPKAQS